MMEGRATKDAAILPKCKGQFYWPIRISATRSSKKLPYRDVTAADRMIMRRRITARLFCPVMFIWLGCLTVTRLLKVTPGADNLKPNENQKSAEPRDGKVPRCWCFLREWLSLSSHP